MYYGINNCYSYFKYGFLFNILFNGGLVIISDDLLNCIFLGLVNMKMEVEKFIENGVVFVDGMEFDDIDVVILVIRFNYSFFFI